MAETETPAEETPKKASKLPLILGVVCALAGGAGAFFFFYSSGGEVSVEEDIVEEDGLSPLPDVVFVPLTPMVVSLGDSTANRHLKFQAHLEVASGSADSVEQLEPRIMDVLNTYLRAVDVQELESRRALIRLRAQMLRRVQVATGEGHVRDLLITEFVLN